MRNDGGWLLGAIICWCVAAALFIMWLRETFGWA